MCSLAEDMLAAAGSLVCCTPVVVVSCMLDCFVGEAVRWRADDVVIRSAMVAWMLSPSLSPDDVG